MTNDELRALLVEALPSVNYSANKWAERYCAIAQKSFRFPSGAEPTKEQVDETFTKWRQQEQLASRITAALAEQDEGGWIRCSGKNGAARNATFIDSDLLSKHICTERNGIWYSRQPLPPLPTERKV